MSREMPRVISVSGIDGSGKTTVVETLADELRASKQPVRIVWLRYNHYLTKIVLAFARLSRHTVYQQFPDCRVGYHEFYRSRLLSHLFISTTWIDTALTSLLCVYLPRLLSRSTTICDRWVPDILIDLEIDTRIDVKRHPFYGPLFWRLVAPGIPMLVLQRDFDDVQRARPEHRYDRNLKRRFELYSELAHSASCRAVDNTGSLENTIRNTREALG